MACRTCNALTRAGTVCKRRASCRSGASKCTHKCWQHDCKWQGRGMGCRKYYRKEGIGVLGDGVTTRSSTLNSRTIKAGLGLFADRKYCVRDYVTFYDGRVIDNRTAERLTTKQQDHVKTLIHKHQHIMGLDVRPPPDGRGGASYANDARSARRTNVKYVHKSLGVTNVIYLEATKPIKSGDEIFVTYDAGYWRLRGL